MKNIRVIVIAASLATALSVPIPVSAIDDRAFNGELGPLIPVPKDAIHAGLVWKSGADSPSMLFLMRDSSMAGTDLADKALIKEIVAETEAALAAGTSPPRTLFEALNNGSPGDPFSGFRQLVFGGFTLSRNLEEAHATRFTHLHLRMENTILADLSDLGRAFRTHPASPKFAVRDLKKQDAALNHAEFSSAGFSRNLGYNLFCAGNVSLTDGRLLFIGGHDKGGNNGLRKLYIYDPEREEWVNRVPAPVRLDYEEDPTGTDPHFMPNCVDHPVATGRPPIIDPDTGRCNPRNEENTDPPDPSDMTFQRWYPTAVTLPDGNVLIVGGSDQNTELIKDVCEDAGGNEGTDVCDTPGAVKVDVDRNDVNRSKVRPPVAEIYFPQTDTTTPLYNAQKHWGFYPHCFVVQTGDGVDEWGVACKMESALTDAGYEGPSYTAADGTTRQDPETLAASIRRGYDPWPLSGRTYILDVVGALADPEHVVPRSLQNSDQHECPDCVVTALSTNHWTYVDTAASAHYFGAETEFVTVGDDGKTSSHLVVAFAGDDGAGSSTNTIIEQIDYAAAAPTWTRGQDFPLGEHHDQNNVVALPTGKLIVLGGTDRRNRRDRFGVYEYDPATKSLRLVANEVVPRFDHSTALLLPDATVIIMGGNRSNLMPAIQPGVQDSPADQDLRNLMVPNWRVYKPAYLFNEDGTEAERPEIEWAPDAIGFGGTFDIKVEDAAEEDGGSEEDDDNDADGGEEDDDVASIASCVIVRTSPITHNWAWGNRWVQLPCSQDGDTVTITEPTHRAQAIAGDYMLFVVNWSGVPSKATHVRLGPAFP